MLKHLERNLHETVVKLSGVEHVKTKVGKKFYKSDVAYQFDLETPAGRGQLPVNDDRQFVHMLSERVCLG
jgi:two-component system, OmpR family, response regulator CpxR